RVWYAPELQPGMTRDQVAARLPVLFNRFNPAGRSHDGLNAGITPRAWQQAVEQALASNGGLAQRRAGAARALSLARSQNWSDNRLALSLMLNARLAPRDQGQAALDALLASAEIYRRTPGGEVHAAHIDMHLAVQALASGQSDMVLELTGRAIPVAERSENAAFVASLGFIRAEALALQGRDAEAERLRLDSLPAARYGFGSDEAARARMDEIARIGSAAQRLARL
ncbi:MAG: ATP-dependent transcriptional regulator, partial [Pararhodobacter sp.]|nr:ATP-dependent transcriptional regulator [Pararhodobacter sp.]